MFQKFIGSKLQRQEERLQHARSEGQGLCLLCHHGHVGCLKMRNPRKGVLPCGCPFQAISREQPPKSMRRCQRRKLRRAKQALQALPAPLPRKRKRRRRRRRRRSSAVHWCSVSVPYVVTPKGEPYVQLSFGQVRKPKKERKVKGRKAPEQAAFVGVAGSLRGGRSVARGREG